MMSRISEEHAIWLEKRGIPLQVAGTAGVRSSGQNLGFDYRRQNGHVAITKWRGPDKRFWIDPSGQTLELWRLHDLNDTSSDTLIITEGEIDALSVLACGLTNVVSVPSGAPSKVGEGNINSCDDRAFAYLWTPEGRLRPEIDRFSRFILATDADHPGFVLRDELAIRLGRNRCYVVTYPGGCKDANNVLVEYGANALVEMIKAAQPLVPDQLVPFSAIPRSTGTAYSTGWGALDPHLKICPPEVMVVTGTPNVGKTQWVVALCANLARVHGMRVAILQFEDGVDRHRDDLERYACAWRTCSDAGKAITMPPEQWIDSYFVTVAPPEDIEDAEDKTLEWLKSRIHEAATRHGCKLVVIDPWNEVEHAWGIYETETHYTARALRHLRAMARSYQIAIIIVCHPSKAGGSKSIDEMTLYDVSGSAHWANKPDHGIILARDPDADDLTLVKIAKSRDFRRRGVPGMVTMRFDPRTATYSVVS